ncbi:MAG: hypothetical protein KBT36_08250 [Kurthia sp.]|nr:hypothetical protein [Candidatus Kurthia equi]
MNLSGVNLGQVTTQQKTQPTVVQQGQVLHGTIKKLYPDQQAEISIGGQKMMAKLETAVQAGNSHFFQVASTEPELTLKMVSGPIDTKASSMDQMKQLMEQMKLPATKDMQRLMLQLVKNDIPFNKEQLLAAEPFLKGLKGAERAQTMDALQKMIELKLPMTKDALQAVIQGSMKSGFTNLLGTLEQSVKADNLLNPTLKNQILQQLLLLKSPLSEQTGSMLAGKMLTGATNRMPAVQDVLQQAGVLAKTSDASAMDQLFNRLKNDPNSAIKILLSQDLSAKKPMQALGQLLATHPTLTKDQMQPIQQAMTRMQLSPTSAHQTELVQTVTAQLNVAKDSIAQLVSQLKSATAEQAPAIIQKLATAIAKDTDLSIQQKQQVIQQLGQVSQNGSKTAFQAVLNAFSQAVGQQPTESAKQQLGQLLGVSKADQAAFFQNIAKVAQESSAPVLQQLVQTVESQQASQITGQSIHLAMKNTLAELGLSLEARMLQTLPENAKLAETLKSLMHAVTNDQASAATKTAAELVVGRMNGQQLLSVDNGTQQQLVMQVPLQFFGKRTDATLQWSGNKNKDGKIDSNFARIMFYLQLETLDETVIDMQVQSRVVTLSIYTDQPASNELVEPLKEVLKTNLEQYDYQLSGVFVKKFSTPVHSVKQHQKVSEQKADGGVDFRV